MISVTSFDFRKNDLGFRKEKILSRERFVQVT